MSGPSLPLDRMVVGVTYHVSATWDGARWQVYVNGLRAED